MRWWGVSFRLDAYTFPEVLDHDSFQTEASSMKIVLARYIITIKHFVSEQKRMGSVLDFALPALKVARFIGVPER
jgi:hypothetical protein